MKRPTIGNSFVNEVIRWEKAMVVSSTKLKYMVSFWTSRKAQWIRGYYQAHMISTKKLYNHLDNQSAIILIGNPKLHTRNKQ